jgi:glutathione S-transferase
MYLIHLVVGLVLAQYIYFSVMVGAARGKYGVAAPATTGNDMFERYFRVHMNTLELLVAFVPSVYTFGTYYAAQYAALLGAVFLIGRFIFFRAYIQDPKSRTLGFRLSILPIAILILGTVIGAIREWLHVLAG